MAETTSPPQSPPAAGAASFVPFRGVSWGLATKIQAVFRGYLARRGERTWIHHDDSHEHHRRWSVVRRHVVNLHIKPHVSRVLGVAEHSLTAALVAWGSAGSGGAAATGWQKQLQGAGQMQHAKEVLRRHNRELEMERVQWIIEKNHIVVERQATFMDDLSAFCSARGRRQTRPRARAQHASAYARMPPTCLPPLERWAGCGGAHPDRWWSWHGGRTPGDGGARGKIARRPHATASAGACATCAAFVERSDGWLAAALPADASHIVPFYREGSLELYTTVNVNRRIALETHPRIFEVRRGGRQGGTGGRGGRRSARNCVCRVTL